MELFRISLTSVVLPDVRGGHRDVLSRTVTMLSSEREAEGWLARGSVCKFFLSTDSYRTRHMFPYIQIKAKTGLAKDKLVLANCDEASLSYQRTWYQTQIKTVYFDSPRLRIQETQEGEQQRALPTMNPSKLVSKSMATTRRLGW